MDINKNIGKGKRGGGDIIPRSHHQLGGYVPFSSTNFGDTSMVVVVVSVTGIMFGRGDRRKCLLVLYFPSLTLYNSV